MALSLAPLANEPLGRTRFARGGPPDAPWELWERTPPRALAGFVAGLWAGTSSSPVARHRTLPNGELVLMLHLGPAQRLVEREGSACDEWLQLGFVAGLQERPATFECYGSMRVASARLLPLGGFALLGGLPQAELRGRVFEAEAVLGGRAGLAELRERMSEARDLGAALDLFEAWLCARLGAARPAHAATRAASARLGAGAEGLRVEALAREASVSPRRLHELFLREVGVPAKRLARILRFRRALELLATAPAVDLARLAQDCGYYDQAHLYRDFRDLAAMTPLDYLAAHGEGLDGPDVLSG